MANEETKKRAEVKPNPSLNQAPPIENVKRNEQTAMERTKVDWKPKMEEDRPFLPKGELVLSEQPQKDDQTAINGIEKKPGQVVEPRTREPIRPFQAAQASRDMQADLQKNQSKEQKLGR